MSERATPGRVIFWAAVVIACLAGMAVVLLVALLVAALDGAW